jgi:hypothetical protein
MSRIAALSRRPPTSKRYTRYSGLITHAAIRTLYSLGVSQAEILRTLNLSRSPRVRNTLERAKRDFPSHPTGRACFAVQLQAFCALERRKEGGLSEEEGCIHTALRKVLRTDNEFLDGLRKLSVGLAMPQPPQSDCGCWSLIRSLLQYQPRNGLDDYWKCLDHSAVFPSSWAALRADVLRYTVDWCRANAVHDWPQNARVAIEWLLRKIDSQAATIIRQRFGIGNNSALKPAAIATLHRTTRWRVRKLETEGIRQLKRIAGNELLREIFLKPLSHSPQPITLSFLQELFDSKKFQQWE